MKKSTYLWVMMFCMVGTIFAQTPAEMSENQAARASESASVTIQDVLLKIENVGNNVSSISNYLTAEEISIFRAYKRSQSSNRLADIIPTAGATETFAVGNGDFFFDPGGPGGGALDSGDPGNYPNCGCITTTTLTGVVDVEFTYFAVFSTFDWLRIYDGTDTTGTILYDNETGANSGDQELPDMIASNGSAIFTSTTGALTFEFRSSTVVDWGGYDVTINPGGTPPMADTAFAREGLDAEYLNFDIAAPATTTIVGPSTVPYESGAITDPANSDLGIILDEGGAVSSIDFTTGVYTSVGTILPPTDSFWGAMNADSSGQVYALALNSFSADATLYTLDLVALTSTMVGATGAGFTFALAIDENDIGYTINNVDDSLYTVDLTTGAVTLVGATGIDTEFGQELTFDRNTNTMYLAAFNNTLFNAEWLSVDVTTGTATSLGEFFPGGFKQMTWVVIPDTVVVITNDECSGAIAMACGDIEMGDTTTNTDTGGFNDSPDAWYSYTGTGAAEFVTFSLCDGTATHDTRLTVYDVCGGVEIALNDDACGLQSEVSFLSDGTTTYFVAVEGFGTADAGPFAIEVSCNPVAANDLCDDAIAINCGDVVAGSTSFATIDNAIAGDCDDTFDPTPFLPTVEVVSPGVWYTYTEAAIPGLISDITLNLCDDADFDTKISVYTGDCGALTCVAANDDNDDCGGFTSTVEFQSDGISTYYILVHGFLQTGDFNLTVDCVPVAPPNDMIVNSIDVDEAGLPYTDPAVNMPGATIEAGGTPADCDNAGVRGVWYNFVAEMGGTATASVTTPAAYTSVTFYTAPDEEAVETDLVLVDYFDNQCLPGTDASILVTAGQAYYVYVANQGGVTDIVIDGDFYLGIGDTTIQGFTYFPNPAADQLNLRSGNGTIESAIIYNILGQEVLSEKVGSSDAQLNVANLSVGTYILKVVVDGELGIYKIVKQ